jgi:hypothetical protein
VSRTTVVRHREAQRNLPRELQGELVYIGRPGPWGNPFKIGPDGTRLEVIEKYRVWLRGQPDLVARARVELRGKMLGCWCAPQRCHGDVLADVADGAEP